LTEQRVGRARKKHTAAVFALVVLVFAVGLAVAGFTYFKTTDSKLQINDADATSALAKQSSDSATYVLCTADLRITGAVEQPANPYGCMLVRYDSSARVLTFTQIPSNLRLKNTAGETVSLLAIYDGEGMAGVISAVSKLFSIEINHVIDTSAQHLSDMVEEVGGLDVDVAVEVDDPTTGTIVVNAGQQTLNPASALAYLRAGNYSDDFASTAAARNEFTWAILQRALGSQGLDFASLVGQASDFIDTDYSASELLSLGEGMRPTSTLTTYFCYVPYDTTTTAGTATAYDETAPGGTYTLDDTAWEQMLANIVAGDDPQTVDTSADGVNPAEVTVEVRNGTSTVGAAATAGNTLTEAGYVVEGVGNVDDSTVYPETLVIYTDDTMSGAAKAVVRDLRNGRVVDGGDFYSSDSDIIVIIGLDWTGVS
jgi:LCP family protein required for cell wall assembly